MEMLNNFPALQAECTLQQYQSECHWLSPEEYAKMLVSYENYCATYGYKSSTSHPSHIYVQPISGEIYYLEGKTVKTCGFPRSAEVKKEYKWKKMNQGGYMPKDNPLIHYRLAVTITGKENYKMRMIELPEGGPIDKVLKKIRAGLVLCHVLKYEKKDAGSKMLPPEKVEAEPFEESKKCFFHIIKENEAGQKIEVDDKEGFDLDNFIESLYGIGEYRKGPPLDL